MGNGDPSRRRVLSSLCALGALPVGTVAGARAGGSASEYWPEFGYDAGNTGAPADNTGPVSDVEDRWRFSTSGRIDSSPVLDGETVYVGTDGGALYALSRDEGAKRWQFGVEESIYGAPAIDDGTVYLCGQDGRLYALDTDDGSVEWTVRADGPLRVSPTVGDGTVYVASVEGTLYAVDRAGTVRWTADLGTEPGPPVLRGESVVVGTRDAVVAVSRSKGTERWRYGLDLESPPPLAAGDRTLYVGAGERSGRLYALSLSGEKRWEFSTESGVAGSPAVSDGTVYLGTRGGPFYAVEGGSTVWTYEPESVVVSPPAVVSGTVYFGDVRGTVYALTVCDGSERWTAATEGPIGTSPAVADGTVFLGSGDGRLHAFGGETRETAVDCRTTQAPTTTTTKTNPLKRTPGYGPVAAVGGIALGVWAGARRATGRDGDDRG